MGLQFSNYFFAAVPNHPTLAMVSEGIKGSMGAKFTGSYVRETIARTGPGAWTSALLATAELHPPSKVR